MSGFDLPKITSKICKFDGCSSASVRNGYCHNHSKKKSVRDKVRSERAAQERDDICGVVLDARCNMSGLGKTRKNRDRMDNPWMGSQLGGILHRLSIPTEDCSLLWSTWQWYCQTLTTYERVCLSKMPFAKIAKIEMAPERLESHAESPPVDDRSEDEKIAAAREGLSRLNTHLDRLDERERRALRQMRTEDGPALYRDRVVTAHGNLTHKAITNLTEIRNKLSRRG